MMILTTRDQSFTCYIGMTKSIRNRLEQQNSGNGSITTTTMPARLRPYAAFAYICGFYNTTSNQR